MNICCSRELIKFEQEAIETSSFFNTLDFSFKMYVHINSYKKIKKSLKKKTAVYYLRYYK